MNIKVNYKQSLKKDDVIIQCHPDNNELQNLLEIINQTKHTHSFKVKKENNEIYHLSQDKIMTFRIENKILTIYTPDAIFTMHERLYKIKEQLDSTFIQISKSEIINTDFIDHLVLNKSGIIEIFFTNQTSTYSSRRYLKHIKEELQL